MHTDETKSTLLRRALKSNAAISAFSGLAVAAGADIAGPLLGYDNPALYVAVGVGLVIFACWVWYCGTRDTIRLRDAKIILWLDILWVLDSAILLFGFPELFTAVGIAMIGFVAIVVSGFAIAEYLGIRRIPA